MAVYVWDEHIATTTETRIIEVHCEKCGCRYFYELTREATGKGHSPYLMFKELAREAAVAEARKNAQQRLKSEAELVPCPRCHWINEELIEGFRRTCFRGWTEKSIWAAAIGIGLCVLPVVIEGDLPGGFEVVIFYGIVMPLLLISAATGVFFFVRMMRRKINPNVRYPDPPRLRGQFPSALLLDEESNQLVPSSQDRL